MMPPEIIPSKASWCLAACHSATTSSPLAKLRIRRPFSLAGPHPKQALCGAYVSCRLAAAEGVSLMAWPLLLGRAGSVRRA